MMQIASPAGVSRSRSATERLRTEQSIAIAQWTPALAIASIGTALITLGTFWNSGHRTYLCSFCLVLAAVHGLAVLMDRRRLAQASPAPVTARELRARVVATGLIACIWCTVPFALAGHATPEQQQLIVYLFAGLSSSSVLLAPLLPAALLLCSLTIFGILFAFPLLHPHGDGLPHALMLLLFWGLTCIVLVRMFQSFAVRVLGKIKLEEQAEIISLLLREFEESASDWLWETDAEFRLRRVSDRLARVAEAEIEVLQGLSLRTLAEQAAANLPPGEEGADGPMRLAECLQARLPFRDLAIPVRLGGQERWWSLTGKPLLDAEGRVLGYRGIGSDITAAKHSERQIAHLARHDSLTDLPNRVLFYELMREACLQSDEYALLYIDLDGFKAINDTLGHGTGDALLIAVSERLRAVSPPGSTVARLGGDEFVVLFSGAVARAGQVAERLIARVSECYQLGTLQVSVGASVGVSLTEHTRNPTDLLRAADLALYRAKADGKGTWRMYEREMDLHARAVQQLQLDLRHAVERGELFLQVQPILDLGSREVIVAEALLRWHHPEHGLISPVDFIPIAESSGLIVPIGAWVLEEACRIAAGWSVPVRIAVNVSPLQFRDGDVLAAVQRALDRTGLPPERLELEITESIFLDAKASTLDCLHALRRCGVRIALDDFGTGYSSLSYLRSFPFDKVKIDRSFIRDLGQDSEATAIVHAITALARSLGMSITAEGVETEEQAGLLRQAGCGQGQGFLFSRPRPPADIAALLGATPRSEAA
jgi:diguanylate cyclase (GGDEF)-like protein